MQSETHDLGMVVTEEGSLLADLPVHGRPSVNDLAHAMRRPLDGNASRPKLVLLKGTTNGGNAYPAWMRSGSRLRPSSGKASPASRKPTGLTSDG